MNKLEKIFGEGFNAGGFEDWNLTASGSEHIVEYHLRDEKHTYSKNALMVRPLQCDSYVYAVYFDSISDISDDDVDYILFLLSNKVEYFMNDEEYATSAKTKKGWADLSGDLYLCSYDNDEGVWVRA